MKIAVCVKWTPVISRLRFDPETKRIVREGVPNELNPFDVLAMNRAAELKRELGADVTAFTMGPPDARRGLARCLAMGADAVFHLNDVAFAGADTLATARALALALRRDAFDLVLFGANSVDAETGQVGPEVAELLGIPQVTSAARLDVDADGGVRAERALENGVEIVEAHLPLLVCVTEGVAPDTLPARDDVRAAEERDIPEIKAADLADDVSQFGAAGSPTWVAEIRQTESSREPELIEEESAVEAARRAVEALRARGALDLSGAGRRPGAPAPDGLRGDGPETWVVAEGGASGLRDVTFELLAAAQPVADAVGGPVVALLIGEPDAAIHADALAQAGADQVALALDPRLGAYATDAYASTLASAIEARSPFAVLLPSTPNGRDMAARTAARLGLGLTGDCIGLEVDSEGRLAQLKPAFGGNIVAPIYSRTLPNMATVRPGVFDALAPNDARAFSDPSALAGHIPPLVGRVIAIPAALPGGDAPIATEFRAAPDDDAATLDKAAAVICVGKGVGGPEEIPQLYELRDLLGAELVCTRDVVEAGWMPRQRQVGLTGRSIAPALYVGVGVRGDFNHTVGIQRSGTMLVVNNSRRASFFRGQCDIGIVGDWREVIPALTAAIRAAL